MRYSEIFSIVMTCLCWKEKKLTLNVYVFHDFEINRINLLLLIAPENFKFRYPVPLPSEDRLSPCKLPQSRTDDASQSTAVIYAVP